MVSLLTYHVFSKYIDSNRLKIFLEREQRKERTIIIPIKIDLSNNISQVRDLISEKTGIESNKLHVWGIQYDDKQYNLKINQKETLDHYRRDDKNIHGILVKEESKIGRSLIPKRFTKVIPRRNPV